ncbi:hypothetical protein BSZ39_02585 [Bowdeniella nasicola]|uniref:Uncharacterized protein n=1 Tax=Bowdeniella nasicola TaxID=208480 RepID=A0A1Q5Q4H6_9ACTO|nr:hypothetical protein [Bowdeniella nasicola]OKL54691.1 hypothetical protein BSZ39_02585 [Bowdeniella nasicola]
MDLFTLRSQVLFVYNKDEECTVVEHHCGTNDFEAYAALDKANAHYDDASRYHVCLVGQRAEIVY